MLVSIETSKDMIEDRVRGCGVCLEVTVELEKPREEGKDEGEGDLARSARTTKDVGAKRKPGRARAI